MRQPGPRTSTIRDRSPVKEHLAVPKAVRLAWGGLKNLLSGVTTVAHHNPYDAAVFENGFPVRVVKRFGWAHSLHFSSDLVEPLPGWSQALAFPDTRRRRNGRECSRRDSGTGASRSFELPHSSDSRRRRSIASRWKFCCGAEPPWSGAPVRISSRSLKRCGRKCCAPACPSAWERTPRSPVKAIWPANSGWRAKRVA